MFLIRSYLAVLTPLLPFVPFRAILLNFVSSFCNGDARHWKPNLRGSCVQGDGYRAREGRIASKAASVARRGVHKEQAEKHTDS